MKQTERPEKVRITCPHCGHEWLADTAVVLSSPAIIYRGETQTVERRVTCPKCDRAVIVTLPKAWLDS
jgi:transcription elongation factor Elf1